MAPTLPAVPGNGVGGTAGAIGEEDRERRGITLVRGAPVTPERSAALSRAALDEAAAGRLHPVIGQRFPLERAADAHAAIEARATVGKTLLVTGAQSEGPVG